MGEFVIKEKSREVQFKNMIEAVGELSARPTSKSASLKAARMRALLNAYIIAEAYKPNTRVAFAGEQFPNEILYPFSLISFNVESMAALFSRSDCIEKFLKLTEEYNFSRDICSNLRSTFGIALANCLPNPDVIIVNNHPCDGSAKLIHMLSKYHEVAFMSLETPTSLDKDSVAYFATQLKDIVHRIEQTLHVEFNQTEFQKAIDYSNKAKEYFSKTVKITEKYRLPTVSRELYELFASNHWGVKEVVGICKTLYEEALQLSKDPETKTTGKRVLWVGQLPNHTFELIEHLEKDVEILFWAALMDCNEQPIDPEDPFSSIAHRSIQYMWHYDRLKQNVGSICRKFEVDGIIVVNAWGCRNLLGLNQMIRELASDNGIKYLTLDADYMDKNNYAFSHVKNRIDAFLEILR